MTTFLLAALLIFVLRLTDISFYTLRLMMMVRHRKALAFIFAFCQASVYVISLRLVLSIIPCITSAIVPSPPATTMML